MSSVEKGLASPCRNVIEWRTSQPDCGEEEERRLRAIQDEGVTDESQAALLASACRSSGIRERCEHADEC